MITLERAAAVRAERGAAYMSSSIGSLSAARPSSAERARFIRALYDSGNLDTMQVVARMYEDFGIAVTEAEVCRAVRRRGETTMPYRRREVP